MSLPSYTIDTSVIVTLHRSMPRDVYVSVWDALESLIAAGRGYLPREAYEELLRVDDVCAPWAKGLPGFVVDATDEEIAVVVRITQRHREWVQETVNAADPFIIAHAVVHEHVIVTQETLKGPGTIDRNLKIPNVAAEDGVECLNFNGLARREGWRF